MVRLRLIVRDHVRFNFRVRVGVRVTIKVKC